MRKRTHLISVAILAIALASMSAAIGYAAARHAAIPARSTKATLKIVKYSPISVQGKGFTPDMKVKVTFSSRTETIRYRTTDRHGAFTLTFHVTADRCMGYVITARQRNGTTAVVHGPRPECAPMGTQ
jgi:hypothetical protein